MTVHGVGIDITDTCRLDRLIAARGHRFLSKWFSPAEIAQCAGRPRPADAFGERYAAKEAVWKALGPSGWSGPLPWLGITVVDDADTGRLEVELSGAAAELADRLGVTSIAVSVTRGPGTTALATAIAS